MIRWIGLRAFQLIMALSFAVVSFTPELPGRVEARSPLSAISLKNVYTQNFDSLPSASGPNWMDDATLPGWFAVQEGLSNSPLLVSNGNSTSGGLFSYGVTTSTERALGSLVNNPLTAVYYGVSFTNDTGSTVTELTITYTGEQWRDGGAGGSTPGAQKLTFAYSLDALDIYNTGTWTPVPTLDFISPIYTNGGTGLKLDGNLDANRKTLSASVPVSIPIGGTLWLRWVDIDDFGRDHGLAIDNLEVVAMTPPPDPRPIILNTLPLEDASDVAIDTPIQITFTEPVWLSAGYNLTCNGQSITLVPSGTSSEASVNYTFSPANGAKLPPASNCTFTLPATSIKDSANQGLAADFTLNFSVTSCGAPFTSIHTIQGSGTTSPLANTSVTLEGVVTADFQTATALSGFFIQSGPGEEDADPATSEGIFVSPGDSANQASVGDRLRLTGQVIEDSGIGSVGFALMTEITNVSEVKKCASGTNMPAPKLVTLPNDANTPPGLERFEGMRVSISGPLTVQQNSYLGQFGQLTLASGGRVFQQNNGTSGLASDVRRMIIVDDGSHTQYPNPIPYYGTDGALRVGDTVTNLVGILDQGRINGGDITAPEQMVFPNTYYRVHPTTAPTFAKTNPRPVTPPSVAGTLKIASFSLDNYFKTLDNGSYAYPYGTYKIHAEDTSTVTYTPLGADSLEEVTRQRSKLASAIKALDADIVGLTEIEALNNAGALGDLVSALNASIGGDPVYAAVLDDIPDPDPVLYGGAEPDFVQVALIYKIAKVSPSGAAQTDTNPVFDRFPVAQTFTSLTNDEKFTVVVNHFASRTGCPDSGADANQSDGQGCWNARRAKQAAELLNFIGTLKQADPDVIVLGDLNAYGVEDPVKALTDGGLVNQVAVYVPVNQRYSFESDGVSGYLDHALTTRSASRQIAGVAFWHVNADEPTVIDYNLENKAVPPVIEGSPDLFSGVTSYRASNRDPLIIGLNLSANQPPQLITPIPDQKTFLGELFTFTVPAGTFRDANPGDLTTLSATMADGSSLPVWLAFDGTAFKGTPVSQDVNPLSIKVTATDTSGATAQDTFDLVILVNQPPVFQAIDRKTVNELETLTFTISADDDDLPNGLLTYSVENKPLNATFDATTRTFSWTPTEGQGEPPFKTYPVTFTVSDGAGSDSITVDIDVYEKNAAPVFEDLPLQEIDEQKSFTLTISATDEDIPVQAKIYKMVRLPAGASFDERTHTMTWTPTEAQGADGAQGDYQAEFTVSDGEASDTLVVNFHVNEVNAKATLNAIGNATIDELIAWTFAPTFSDADLPANPLAFRLENGAPSGLALDAKTGKLSWTPDEAQGPGSYPVTLYLTDGKAEVLQTFTITVNEKNTAPYFTKLADQTVGPFATLTFDITVADNDLPKQGLTIAVKPGTLPDSASFTFAQGKGIFTWKPGLRAAGQHIVTFSVTDGSQSIEKSIVITVTEPLRLFLPWLQRQP